MVPTDSLGWMMHRWEEERKLGSVEISDGPVERYQNVFKANVKTDAQKGVKNMTKRIIWRMKPAAALLEVDL